MNRLHSKYDLPCDIHRMISESTKILRSSRYSDQFKFDPVTDEKVEKNKSTNRIVILLICFSKYPTLQYVWSRINHHQVVVARPCRLFFLSEEIKEREMFSSNLLVIIRCYR